MSNETFIDFVKVPFQSVQVGQEFWMNPEKPDSRGQKIVARGNKKRFSTGAASAQPVEGQEIVQNLPVNAEFRGTGVGWHIPDQRMVYIKKNG